MMDYTIFNTEKLVNIMLSQEWQHDCFIGPDSNLNRKLRCIVTYGDGDNKWSLRHSNGPLQGTFWDSYPDDFHSPELALLQLAKAYPPPNVKLLFATHGNPPSARMRDRT